MEEKLIRYNLLPMNAHMIAFLKEQFPMYRDVESFELVKFVGAKPYFYSRQYIDTHTIEELNESFLLEARLYADS
jgi:hypothetical protein